MAYFPFFLDLEGQNGLVAGGGSVALRKAQALLEFGARLTVVSLSFCKPFQQLAEEADLRGRIRLIQRAFAKEDLEGMLFVIAATNQPQVNRSIAALCRERRLLVNVADHSEEGAFSFPALVKRDGIVVGISSGSSSPLLAKSLRQKAEQLIPPYYSAISEQLGQLRSCVKELPSQEERRQCYRELLEAGEQRQRALDENELAQILTKYFSAKPLT